MKRPQRHFYRAVCWLAILSLLVPTARAAPEAHAKGRPLPQGRAVLSNDRLRAFLYGNGQFTLETADGRDLLYPSATSYLTLRVDGAAYTNEAGTLRIITPLTQEGDLRAALAYESPEGIVLRHEFTLRGAALELRMTVTNSGTGNHTVGLRYLLDTQVGDNDGSPLWSGGQVYTREAEISPPFGTWKGYDRIPNWTLASEGTWLTSPSRVVFAHWPTASRTDWDYMPDPNRPFYTPGYVTSPESDSCVLAYFQLGTLPAGASREVVLFYGTAAPEAEGIQALLDELDALHIAVRNKLIADANNLAAAEAIAYRIITKNNPNPAALYGNILKTLGWTRAIGEFIRDRTFTGFIPLVVKEVLGKLILSLAKEKREELQKAVEHIYQDLDADDPQLQEKIARFLFEGSEGPHLNDTLEQIDREYEAFRREIEQRYSELPNGYPLQDVLSNLRMYRHAVERAASQEVTLPYMDPSGPSISFVKTGVMPGWRNTAERFAPLQQQANRYRLAAYAVGIAAGLAKVVAALGTGGFTLAVEASAALGMFGLGIFAGDQGAVAIDLAVDQLFAVVALQAFTALPFEESHTAESFSRMLQYVRATLSDPAAWSGYAGEIVAIELPDIILPSGEDIGETRGSVTVRNTGSHNATVHLFLDIQGPTSVNRGTISIAQQPAPVQLRAGEEATIPITYGAPGTQMWNRVEKYRVIVYVSFGPVVRHSGEYPQFAEETLLYVGSREAAEAVRRARVGVVSSGKLTEGEAVDARLQIPPDTATAVLELGYGGSDLDLHLYDAAGRHVGVNYDTGQIEMDIPGVEYSGAGENPEWMRIRGLQPQELRAQVVAVDTDAPETYELVATMYPAMPPVLWASPLTFEASRAAAQTELRASGEIREVGGDSGVRDLRVEVGDLRSARGGIIPGSQVRVTLPDTRLAAGSQLDLQAQLLPYQVSEEIYSGTLTVTGVDERTGAVVVTQARVTVAAGEEESAPPPQNTPWGLVIALVVVFGGGLLVALLTRRERSVPTLRARAALYLTQGQANRSYIPIAKQTLSIGRDPGCDLVLLDPQVSWHHAQIVMTPYGYLLQDLGSTNGTWVNGVPVREHTLRAGDQIQVGQSILTFWYAAE